MSEVLGVHGMAQQQRGRSQLIAVWEPAFRDGVEIAGGRDAVVPSFGLAFYGDLFLSAAAQGEAAAQELGDGGRQEGAAKGAAILEGEAGAPALESVSAAVDSPTLSHDSVLDRPATLGRCPRTSAVWLLGVASHVDHPEGGHVGVGATAMPTGGFWPMHG
jgi:hypothetical protein